jgi:hypothetical protein
VLRYEVHKNHLTQIAVTTTTITITITMAYS